MSVAQPDIYCHRCNVCAIRNGHINRIRCPKCGGRWRKWGDSERKELGFNAMPVQWVEPAIFKAAPEKPAPPIAVAPANGEDDVEGQLPMFADDDGLLRGLSPAK